MKNMQGQGTTLKPKAYQPDLIGILQLRPENTVILTSGMDKDICAKN